MRSLPRPAGGSPPADMRGDARPNGQLGKLRGAPDLRSRKDRSRGSREVGIDDRPVRREQLEGAQVGEWDESHLA